MAIAAVAEEGEEVVAAEAAEVPMEAAAGAAASPQALRAGTEAMGATAGEAAGIAGMTARWLQATMAAETEVVCLLLTLAMAWLWAR